MTMQRCKSTSAQLGLEWKASLKSPISPGRRLPEFGLLSLDHFYQDMVAASESATVVKDYSVSQGSVVSLMKDYPGQMLKLHPCYLTPIKCRV